MPALYCLSQSYFFNWIEKNDISLSHIVYSCLVLLQRLLLCEWENRLRCRHLKFINIIRLKKRSFEPIRPQQMRNIFSKEQISFRLLGFFCWKVVLSGNWVAVLSVDTGKSGFEQWFMESLWDFCSSISSHLKVGRSNA